MHSIPPLKGSLKYFLYDPLLLGSFFPTHVFQDSSSSIMELMGQQTHHPKSFCKSFSRISLGKYALSECINPSTFLKIYTIVAVPFLVFHGTLVGREDSPGIHQKARNFMRKVSQKLDLSNLEIEPSQKLLEHVLDI